ncbi:MmgE/PrpD family protein [Roseovarius carneus]|uniref:MmgE/PrpD family protein n=1 Tax=Roseovarius carneus TaxID=2853164 RepID=UPI001CC90669|nr:MmgE/PrpD family protein [Roseovarius carneus]
MITPSHTPNDAQFERIAAFGLGHLEVPEAALRHCATLLIDTLGVAAGAAGMQAGRITRQFAVDYHMPGPGGAAATMLFDGRRASMPGAIWAVASQIDNLDGHDGYNPTKGHIGCAVVSALIALAKHREMSGREALTALAMS